ncbi:hypothetical protein [Qingrenia yutianensis]|uniref:Uncharacterized protein n=1 Tax=Qingrenia yutianensis TaxID=2763676 RepID=A0A926FBM1_9FIRM|nr:hypothetical protein [Qingrenia yutianensis]MBC8597515.1 hypothetical protein [Qingrenia yutianensis]
MNIAGIDNRTQLAAVLSHTDHSSLRKLAVTFRIPPFFRLIGYEPVYLFNLFLGGKSGVTVLSVSDSFVLDII